MPCHNPDIQFVARFFFCRPHYAVVDKQSYVFNLTLFHGFVANSLYFSVEKKKKTFSVKTLNWIINVTAGGKKVLFL